MMTAFVITHTTAKENKTYDSMKTAKINSAVDNAERIKARVATFLAILERG